MTVPDAQAASKVKGAAAATPLAPTADSTSRVAAPAYLSAAWWEQHWQEIDKRIYECVGIWIDQWWPPRRDGIAEAVGVVFGVERHNQHEAIAKIKDRVLALETTNSFEERFNKLANEVKHGTEIPQSELLAKIDRLQRQLDELRRVTGQPGPQGPPGPPGKLPRVKDYVAGCVHYEADVVSHDDALWQARCDTVHAPPHDDWVCLARAGRDGLTPTICGTYTAYGKYSKLDIVASDGAAFIARRDNPGLCPGDGWLLLSRQGKPGRRGEPGPAGRDGKNAETRVIRLQGWQVDAANFVITPLVLDGTRTIEGPELSLRPMFERYHEEANR
jgi:hypothetical protein